MSREASLAVHAALTKSGQSGQSAASSSGRRGPSGAASHSCHTFAALIGKYHPSLFTSSLPSSLPYLLPLITSNVFVSLSVCLFIFSLIFSLIPPLSSTIIYYTTDTTVSAVVEGTCTAVSLSQLGPNIPYYVKVIDQLAHFTHP